MRSRSSIVFLALAAAVAVCFVCLRSAETQSSLRRITNTTEEGISINPSISGDGRIIGFESTEDIAGAGGSNSFRAIRGNISVDPPTFFQMGRSRAVAPAVSQDGSRIAFASKDDPLGNNVDGNSEIFIFNGSNLVQVTNTTPSNPANRVTEGNFQPSISDDGRFVAFSSNRNLTSQNGDGNLEVVVFDSVAATFTQLTNSTGMVGFSDAKISGDGSAIACIRDTGATPSTNRDLLRINRTNAAQTVLALNVARLAMTYGRAISDDGSRVAYSSETAANSTQVFFYDGRSGNINRQVTTLGTRATEVPLHPTISGDGRRIAFATRRALTGFSNSDASVELYTYDIPTVTFARITNATSNDADCFDGSSPVCEVVSSLNDDGSTVVFNFPRALSGAVTSGLENQSEIYATGVASRPPFGTLTSILNQASLGHEPSPIKAVAPNSIAAAFGSVLANTTQRPQKQPDGTFPTNVGGTTVTVNGRAAQIFFVSPERVHFLVPSQTEIGNAEVVITNADGFASKGTVPILLAAPGIFTKTGDGIGEGMILNTDTQAEGPFDPSSGNLRLSIFSTGVRNGITKTVNIGGRVVTPEAVIQSPEMPGLDEVVVRVPTDLRGTGKVTLFIQADGRDSNPVTVKFEGDPSRNIIINEVLADPPDGIAGDANHDGVRDGTQDEFVELVNGTSSEVISLSGWTIRTRAIGSNTESTRFTFASGTSLPAGQAIVVFGGGNENFNPADTIFGCAQVVKATTSAGLSLTNSGLTILIYDAAGNEIRSFSYGGSTGFEGDNNQSLTRSPDITGAYVQHTAAPDANGRRFSPGLRTNGTPFGNCPGILTTVVISPPAATIDFGQTQQFTAQAFDQFGRVMTGVTITFSSDNTNVATVESVTMNSSTGVATANVKGQNPGVANITASATDGSNTVNSPPAVLTVNGPALAINDVTQTEGNSGTTTFTFTVSLSAPAPAGGVSFDIATADGTATTANNDYVANSTTGKTIAAGLSSTTFDVTVNGDTQVESNENFFVNITNASNATIGDGQGQGTIQNDDVAVLAISQVYPGGGLTGATFRNDFVEVFNRGTTTVNFAVTPYSVQFLSTSGSTWAKTDLTSGTLAPGRYFLVQETSGSANGSLLPTPDATGSLNLTSTTPGKVALVAGTTLLTGSCPGDDGSTPFNPISATIADFVGYSGSLSTANHCYEGPGPASFTSGSNTTADFRKSGGCIDTNDNAADFVVATPNPRNSASPANDCNTGFRPDITISDVAVTEGNSGTSTATFTVSLSAPNNAQTVTVNFATADGTATTANNDYQLSSGTVTFIPGDTSEQVAITINGDTNLESTETFFVNLSNPTNAAILDGQGVGTINEDDSPPTLTINDVSLNEGNSGTTTFAFTVHLSAPALTGGVTFDIATADGTAQDDNPATEDNDYVGQALAAQTIPAGSQDYTFNVTVNGDLNVEPNETFTVNVTNVSGATVGDGTGQGTILNDDSPVLNLNDVSLSEGNSGTTTFTFTVTSTLPAPAGGITFDIATADGTAQDDNPASEDNDYVARSLTSQTIPETQTTYTFDVTVNGDTLVESNETFFVNITNVSPNATIGDGAGQGTIQNDDTATLVISQVYAGGNNSGAPFQNDFVEIFNRGTTTVDFSVTPYSVQYASVGSNFGSSKTNLSSGSIAPGKYFLVQESGGTTNGVPLPTADAIGTIAMAATSGKVALVAGTTALSAATCPGDDGSSPFNPNDATVADFVGYGSTAAAAGHCYEGSAPTAAPGNTTADVRKGGGCVDTNDNAADFFVHTPLPRNSSTAANTCSGQTADIVINDVTVTETDSGTVSANFTVSLISASSSTITVDYATANGTAVEPGDYTAIPTTQLIFNPGETSKPVSVLVNGDTLDEPNETFLVNLSNATNAAIFDHQGQGTITDNDVAPDLTINDVSQNETNAGTTTFTFTVHLSAPALSGGVTFDIATADGTAQDDNPVTEDNDYVPQSLTAQTIPAGNQDYVFSVTVNGDLNIESNENFFVNVTNVTGANLSDGQGVGNINNDDAPPAFADLSVTKTDSPDPVAVGNDITYTITVTNAGPDAAGNAVMSDTVPLNATFRSITAPAGWTCPTQPAVGGTGLVSCTNPSFAIGSAVFTMVVRVNSGVADNTLISNTATISSSATDSNSSNDSDTETTTAKQPLLVISQIYPGGGNAGATYQNDFIEIFNRGTTTVDFAITPYSIQYISQAGNFGSTAAANKTDITSGTLAPGQYFLIRGASGGANGVALPTPDVLGSIAMSATAGKVALVLGTSALAAASCPGDDGVSPFNPNNAAIVDFIGYGGTAASTTCYEGAGPAPFSTSTAGGLDPDARSTIRTNSCIDTNVNSADFSNPTTAPVARNSATALTPCP